MITHLSSSPHSNIAPGLQADSSRLMGLESDLATALSHSEELAEVQGSPGDWDTACHHQWDRVEDILDVIHGLVSEMHAAIIRGDESGALQARASWTAVQDEETKLADALAGMRAQSRELNETARDEWLELVLIVESHRKVILTAAVGFDLRMKAWGNEILMADEAVSYLPPVRPGVDGNAPLDDVRKLDQAAIEIEQEQHQVLDLKDHIKAMFMWVEAPEERVHKQAQAEPQAA